MASLLATRAVQHQVTELQVLIKTAACGFFCGGVGEFGTWLEMGWRFGMFWCGKCGVFVIFVAGKGP